ncbi:SWI/SNF-related matrix-associated actin-dependent regulator of chromatin subfamily A-like protein 1 [Nematocida sp. AWRm80]|nr:SWI/SNF-related matrix-associated actin-dependent regulator of chromatin subfamily A-like protein 1 [Nematocida sp. AWRm80]
MEKVALGNLQTGTPIIKPVYPKGHVHRIALLDENTVVVSPSCRHISALLINSSNSKYDLNKNQWSFAIGEYSTVINCILKECKVQRQNTFILPEIEAPPHSLMQALESRYIERHSKETENRTIDTYSHLMATVLRDSTEESEDIVLHEFQIESIRIAMERKYRLLIADDMGLGKTIQAIAIAKTYLNIHPEENKTLLVISESTHTKMWTEMVSKYITSTLLDIKKTYSSRTSTCTAMITTYRLATDYLTQYTPNQFFMSIIDESQCLKNPESKRTQEIVPFLTKIQRVILLSGTPALSKSTELYTQISIVNPTLFTEEEFHRRYCQVNESLLKAVNWKYKKKIMYSGNINSEELKIAVNTFIMIRRLKADCITLQSKKRVKVLFQTTVADQQKQIRISTNPTSELLQQYSVAAKEKIPDIISFVTEIRKKTKEKIIIFAHHREMITAIFTALKERAIKIDGSTPSKQRKDLCDTFKTNKNIDTAVLSIVTCSTGLTLTCATIVLFAELPWRPGDIHQAEDRVHRIGQTNKVTIYYLIASYVDKKIWPLLERKITALSELGVAKKDSTPIPTYKYNPKQSILQMF